MSAPFVLAAYGVYSYRSTNFTRPGGTSTVDPSYRQVPTELIDLTGLSIVELRHCDKNVLRPSLDRVMRQVERPRANINEAGPPGRVD